MKKLLIVFIKNPENGKVKTRLAKDIGQEKAFQVYEKLLQITENCLTEIKDDVRVYCSDSLNTPFFRNYPKFLQSGEDLGEKMKNAFQQGFADGYESILLIGSDLPDIRSTHIYKAFEKLKEADFVFGPASDGGYYLIGMKAAHSFPFEGIPWSTSSVYALSKESILDRGFSIAEIEELNDIDSFEDLKNASINLYF